MSRPIYTKESFLLKLESRIIHTVSVKSEILRNNYISEMIHQKNEKINKKKRKLKSIRMVNPGIEIDEELFFEDSDEEIKEPPKIFIPPVPNPILFAIYTPLENTIWVSIDGYDSGYLYEYNLNTSKLTKSTKIPNTFDVPLTAINML